MWNGKAGRSVDTSRKFQPGRHRQSESPVRIGRTDIPAVAEGGTHFIEALIKVINLWKEGFQIFREHRIEVPRAAGNAPLNPARTEIGTEIRIEAGIGRGSRAHRPARQFVLHHRKPAKGRES